MFVTVYALCDLIDKYIGYLQDARKSDMYTKDYEKEMQRLIIKNFEQLQYRSCNIKLIARYERKIIKVLKGAKYV